MNGAISGLGFLPWPATQKYDLSKPPLVTSSPTPPQASVGDRVGGIITSTCSLQLISNFTLRSFILKCLRHFLLEITKEMHQSLKPVSVHYRNKGWKNSENSRIFPALPGVVSISHVEWEPW